MDKLSSADVLRVNAIVKLAGDDPELIGGAIGKMAFDIACERGLSEDELEKLAQGLVRRGIQAMGKLFKGKKPVGGAIGSAGPRVDAAARAAIAKNFGNPALKARSGVVQVK